jgi:hypothetical protein
VLVKTSALGTIFEILNLKNISKIKNKERGIIEKLGIFLLKRPAKERAPKIINIKNLKYLILMPVYLK